MNVRKNRSVDFAIRTLTEPERQKVLAWLDHLANWENDQPTRDASKTSFDENVLVLTSDDLSIYFTLDNEKKLITVLDIAKPSRFEIANHAAE